MKNRILIIALDTDWSGISRLPSGLSRAGFEVYALCPEKSYLAKTIFLADSILYPTFTYSRSKIIYLLILISIIRFKPDLLIPGDEDSILALQNFSNILAKIPFASNVMKLIRRSLVPRKYDSLILSKSNFQEKCQELGIKSPKNLVVKDLESAITAANVLGYPVVLKDDSGYGGSGVFICSNDDEIIFNMSKRIVKKYSQNISIFLKRLFFISIFTLDKKISVQQYIKGQVGQSPFCAIDGIVLATNPMLKIRTFPGVTGPSSVTRGIENSDIVDYVKKVTKELHFTGFGSLEFIVEDGTNLIYVIEFNPRPTPTCHVSNEVLANDLCIFLFKGINSQPIELGQYRPFTIALFPGEKRRDPDSHFLVEAFHDVPVNDPLLLLALDN